MAPRPSVWHLPYFLLEILFLAAACHFCNGLLGDFFWGRRHLSRPGGSPGRARRAGRGLAGSRLCQLRDLGKLFTLSEVGNRTGVFHSFFCLFVWAGVFKLLNSVSKIEFHERV